MATVKVRWDIVGHPEEYEQGRCMTEEMHGWLERRLGKKLLFVMRR